MSELAPLISRIMERHDISQRRLSAAMNFRRHSIRRFLKGGDMPFGRVEQLLDALGYRLTIEHVGEPKVASAPNGRPATDCAPPPKRKLIGYAGKGANGREL